MISIEEGFDFLGQNVRKYKGKLLIKPAKKSVKALLFKIRSILKNQQHLSAGYLIAKLNPIIRGWANYHRHVVSKETFALIEYQLYQALWRWAKRRHRNKSNRWIYAQYFRPKHKCRSGFYGQLKSKDGSVHSQRLVKNGYKFQSTDTSKSKLKPIPLTQNGNAILRDAWMPIWHPSGQGDAPCFISGNLRMGGARSVRTKSRQSLAGKITISFTRSMVELTPLTTGSCYIQPVTNNSTALDFLF